MTDSVYDRASVYEEDDAVIYRASSLGYCIGALVRARMGVTGSAPPDVMQERFDEGREWEERVILAGLGVDWTLLEGRKLAKYGTVLDSGQVETEIRFGADPVKVIRCHPDGVAIAPTVFSTDHPGNSKRRVVEAKFFGPDLFYKTVTEGLGYNYRMQLSIEMHSTGLGALYVIGKKERNPETGEVTLGEVVTEEYDTPPMSLAEIKMRVLEVEGWYTRGEMPPCPVPFDYPSAYWADHDTPERVDISDDQMQKLVAAYEVMVEEQGYVEAGVKLLRSQMLDRMQELGVKTGTSAGYTVTVVEPKQGNVSWAKAYKELSKVTGERVDEDEFRGEKGKPYVAVKKDEADE